MTAFHLSTAPGSTEALFRGGRKGRGERGVYRFWTAVLRRPSAVVTARARRSLGPWARFARFGRSARDADAWIWLNVLEAGRAVRRIRPSTGTEVARWLRTHPGDARHVRWVALR